MEYLWKKHPLTGEYVNFFETIRNKYDNDFAGWDKVLSGNLKWLNTYKMMAKCNRKSLNKLQEGQRKFMVSNFNGAIVSYNQSLCYAEADSLNESLTYLNRAECFYKMKMYDKALIDIDLAGNLKEHSKRNRNRLAWCKAECERYVKLGFQREMETTVPQLSFEPHKNFASMANVLEIRENDEFGRHIVAKCDIDAGKTIIVAEIFASGTITATELCCRNCNQINRNLIPCKMCSNTMFCSTFCAHRQGVHRLECNSFFHVISDPSLKLAIQTILIAINMFNTIDDLMKFVEEVIRQQRLPAQTSDMQSRYSIFLKLHQSFSETRIYPAYQTYSVLLSLPRVKRLFNTERKQMFLLHLTLHHLTVIPQNVFYQEKFHQDWISSRYIYDVLSLINHSCVPNVFNLSTFNEIGYGVTLRPIRKGEQIFINYLGVNQNESKEYRQKKLRLWRFECKCARCEPDDWPASVVQCPGTVEIDPSFKYIMANCQLGYCKASNTELGNRSRLKNECVKFLQRFGHLALAREVRFVRRCYTLH